jgi:hypothetical protein
MWHVLEMLFRVCGNDLGMEREPVREPICLSVSLPVRLSVCMSVCPSVWRSVWRSVCRYVGAVCLSVWRYVCRSGGLSVCPSVCLCLSGTGGATLPVCLSVGRSVCMSVCRSVCMYVCMYVCMSVCLSACMPVCLSVCQSVCRSVGLFVCLSVCMLSGCPQVAWLKTSQVDFAPSTTFRFWEGGDWYCCVCLGLACACHFRSEGPWGPRPMASEGEPHRTRPKLPKVTKGTSQTTGLKHDDAATLATT